MDRNGIYWLIFAISLTGVADGMTRAQIKNTGKMLKTNCMKKVPVSEELVNGISEHNFVEDRNLMCFIACMLELTSVVKKNKLNIDACLKQIDMMYPPDIKETAKAAVMECKEIPKKYKDICEASFWMAKCMHDYKPEDFLFV